MFSPMRRRSILLEVVKEVVEGEEFGRGGLSAAEGEELAGEGGCAVGGLGDLLEGLVKEVAGRRPAPGTWRRSR